jgi:hypothetical protein
MDDLAKDGRLPAPRRDQGAVEHLACPYCGAYGVERLYVATAHLDSCSCESCGARWDEDARSGEFQGRSERASVLVRRRRS